MAGFEFLSEGFSSSHEFHSLRRFSIVPMVLARLAVTVVDMYAAL